MIRRIAGILALIVVTGCGVDGEPIPPTQGLVSWLTPVPVQVLPLDK